MMPKELCRIVSCCGVLALVASNAADAQVSGYNLFEFQFGNTPFTSPADLTTSFDQLNVGYASGNLSGTVRAEQFLSPNQAKSYQQLSQFRAEYRDEDVEVSVGNFYDILGRGLLLRAYEIPAVVYEDAASRVRQGFYRDIYGFRAKYQSEFYSIKALRGQPLINVLPPTVDRDDRRKDLIEAIEGTVSVSDATAGVVLMRNNSDAGNNDYASVNVAAELPANVAVYVELAQQVGPDNAVLSFGDTPYALYANATISTRTLGVSAEFKDYNDFFLGSGFNDPPSLIKEHPYAVLNRSTHVLNVTDESGWQAELYYRFDSGVMLTGNVTQAVNRFNTRYTFTEYFAELAVPIGDRTSSKVFADVASDEFRFEKQRISAGGYAERQFENRLSASIDVEAQSYRRTLGNPTDITNFLLGVTVSRSTRYTVGIVGERSTDPFLMDDPRTLDVETDPRFWLGASFGYRPNRHHSFALFTGTRRGGPACTSGICYEVLDFEGAELRITTRF